MNSIWVLLILINNCKVRLNHKYLKLKNKIKEKLIYLMVEIKNGDEKWIRGSRVPINGMNLTF